MKKLMIAALVAAMGGVAMAADACAEAAGCAYAYRIKLAGKCTTTKYKAAASECAEGNCWVKPKSYRVAGYLYNAADCGDDACCPLADNGFKSHFWDANKAEVKFETVEFAVYEVLRNGGAMDKAQICLKLDDLVLAGFGSYKPSKNYLLSANGFFAGTLAAPECGGLGEDCTDTAAAQVFGPCGLEPGDATAAIAYGRWSLTYKPEHSAKLISYGVDAEYPACLLPTGFQKSEE